MKLYQRITYELLSGSKTTKEIRRAIPDKSGQCIAATISNYSELFIRLDKGLVGLCSRDEHLVRRTKFISSFALYKRIVNLLATDPLELQRMYALLPDQKQVSIRATICMRKDLFVVAGTRKARIIGRKNRDEYILDKYPAQVKKTKILKEKSVCIADMLEIILTSGPKTLRQIQALLPHLQRDSITWKLSLHQKFIRDEDGLWYLHKE